MSEEGEQLVTDNCVMLLSATQHLDELSTEELAQVTKLIGFAVKSILLCRTRALGPSERMETHFAETEAKNQTTH